MAEKIICTDPSLQRSNYVCALLKNLVDAGVQPAPAPDDIGESYAAPCKQVNNCYSEQSKIMNQL